MKRGGASYPCGDGEVEADVLLCLCGPRDDAKSSQYVSSVHVKVRLSSHLRLLEPLRELMEPGKGVARGVDAAVDLLLAQLMRPVRCGLLLHVRIQQRLGVGECTEMLE